MSDAQKAALGTALSAFANDPAKVAALKQDILDKKNAKKVAKAVTTQAAKTAAAPAPKAPAKTKAPAKAAPAPAAKAAPTAVVKLLQSVSAERYILTDHRGNVVPFKEQGKLVWSSLSAKYPGNLSGHPAYDKGRAFLQYHQNTTAAREKAFSGRNKTRLLDMSANVFRGPVKRADGSLDWSRTTFVANETAYEAYLASVQEARPA